MRRALLLACLLVSAAGASAQERVLRGDLGAFRDTLAAGGELRLRPFVLPQSLSLRLEGVALDTTQYVLDARTGRLALRLAPPPDSAAVLVAVYRTLPLEAFAAPLARRRIDTAAVDTLGRQRVIEAGRAEEPLFAELPRLRRRGSISRGLVAGNRRDVSFESGLRMELAGEIAEGVEVQAVLTDASTPIQPEGTTQRLSDFDRVYVQLDTRRGQARLGDIDLAFTGTEFAPFVRKLQGAAVAAELPAAGPVAGGRVTVAGAAERGRFRSQDLAPAEGVQGPYRLLGEQGEEFVIVIAGSERVYLDGALLTRGESHDYVIDYATGELTFTPRRLITAERRITVEFEYTTHEFTRTLLGAEAEVQLWGRADGSPRARLRTTVLREADGATFADELGLSEADLDLIAEAGAGPAFRSGAERVPFDPESPFVLYARRDTVLAGETFEVYVPATAAADTVYRVRFSRVAPGTGQYARRGGAVNGILYEWVGPEGGDYLPVRLLPKPEMRQLVDLAGSIEPVEGLEVFGEMARSLHDPNRLAAIGGEGGGAYHGGLRLAPLALGGGTLSGALAGRLREASFRAFDRIRPVEFNRQWNLARAGTGLAGLDTLREATAEGWIEWAASERTALRAEGGRIALGDLFEARRGAASLRLQEGAWPALSYRLDVVDSEDRIGGEAGRWLRQQGRLSRPLGRALVPFVEVEHERRAQRVLGTDSLAATAFAFAEVRPGLEWAGEALTAGLRLGWREEQLPLEGRLAAASTAATLEADARYRAGDGFSSEARAAYRRRRVAEPFRLLGQEDAESVAVQWSSRWSPLARAVELNTVYEALTERAPVLQEVYLHVGPELGEYVWEDLNGDGVQQLDEFRLAATPLEGEYARVLVPGDELIPTVGAQGSLRLRLDPSRLWAEASGWRRALAQVVSQTTLDVQERSEERDLLRVYLFRPSVLQQPETTLSGRFRVAQEFQLFRGSARYGGRLHGQHLRSTNRLATGLERRLAESVEAEAQAQLLAPLTLRLRGSLERNDSESPFAARAFDIRGVKAEPEATWRFSPFVALTGGLRLARNRDAAGAGREARVLIVPLSLRLQAAHRLQASVRAERADVSVSGPEAVGQALFELTERRGPGTSYLWTVSGDYGINRYLRASLLYEGRAPAGVPVIHNVRFQLSAVF